MTAPMPMSWAEVVALARRANDHYSMTERQQELLYELALTMPEGGQIVELGVCHGKTGIVLAIAARERGGDYLGIDNWSLEGSYQEVTRLFNEILPGRPGWCLSESSTHDAYWREWGPATDFLVIDAGHDEANVSKDCELWIPKVVPGGVVVFDDWPSGKGWAESCHAAIRVHAEKWCAEWEWVASYGKTVAFRRPM